MKALDPQVLTIALETTQTNLTATPDLIQDCHAAYRQADPRVRRLFNQALFEKIYIDEAVCTRPGHMRQ